MINDNERRDQDWINPPEPKEDIEPDVDAIGDEMWLRKKEEEEERQQQIIESCCQLGDVK